MRRGRSRLCLAALLVPLATTGAGGAAGPDGGAPGFRSSARAPGAPVAAAHDLHIAYADLGIEDVVVAGRIRMFRDDLERALGPRVGADAVDLRPGADADALVLAYIRDHLRIEADGALLDPAILRSGEDELDREPVWWVVVQYRAAAPVSELRVRNTLLFELHDDQRNIMKFVRFPEEKEKTIYFVAGEEEARVRL